MSKIVRTEDELTQIYTDGEWDEAGYGKGYAERGLRDVYEAGRQDAKDELIEALKINPKAHSALIATAEEIADGFGYDSLKQTGTKHERSITVANTLTELIAALHKEEKHTLILGESREMFIQRLINVISVGLEPSVYAVKSPEFDRGVNAGLEWAIGALEIEKEELDERD